MSVQPGATSGSIESSLPQMRIPTQADEWSTQLPVTKTVAPHSASKASHHASERRTGASEPERSRWDNGNTLDQAKSHGDSLPDAVNRKLPAATQKQHVPAIVAEEVGTRSWLRRVSKVPRDQKEILDPSSSHYPPLPGHDGRSGALPIKLLETFCARADAGAEEKAPAANHNAQEQARPIASNAEQTIDANNDNDQEVSASQWPESPERPPRKALLPPEGPESSRPPSLSPINQGQGQVPPDSPPFSAQHSNLERSNSSPISAHSTKQQTALARVQSSATDSLSEVESDGEDEHTSSHTSSLHKSRPFSKIQLQNNRTVTRQQIHKGSDYTSGKLSKPLRADQPHSTADLLVQVKRTPHPGRREYPGVDQTVGNPMSTFVPSTYQENASRSPAVEIDALPVPPQTDGMATNSPGVSPKRACKDPSTVNGPRGANDRLESAINLDKITRAAREYRRRVLKPISKTTVAPEQPDGQRTSLRADPTPMGAPVATGSPSAGHRASDRGSLQKHLNNVTLFERFCLAYHDYSGSQKQFEGACRLLSREYAGKRIHSVLLDDFVFHHTQTYPSYFSECHTSGEEPLAYSDYFDTVEPTHMKKIINAADLQKHSASNFKASETQQSSAKARQHGDGRSRMPLKTRTHRDAAHRKEADEAVFGPDEDGDMEPSIERHISQSQHPPVEEWLQGTIADRAESPELGTPNVDRSLDSHAGSGPVESPPKSLKRSLPTDVEVFKSQKRPRQSGSDVRTPTFDRVNATPQRQRLASINRATKLPATSSLTMPPLSQSRRRTLPQSFSQVAIKKEPTENASFPAFASATPSASLRRSLGTQPLRTSSKPWAPVQTPMRSSAPLKPGSVGRLTRANGVGPVQRSLLHSEKTAFQRFAASWEKLPGESPAREWRQNIYKDVGGMNVDPYALIDVTQWRK